MFVIKVFRYIFNILRDFFRMSLVLTFYYNMLSPHVKCVNGGRIKIYRNTKLYFEKGAKIIIENGTFSLGFGKPCGAKNPSLVRVWRGGLMHVYGDCMIEYGADVLLHADAVLEIKNDSYINCYCLIRCSNHILLGEDFLSSTNLELRDSDGHELNGVKKNGPIIIGNHVWLGTRVTVLEGVTIGDGAVIGACSLVTKNIPPKCLAYGVPATERRNNIEWEK